MLIALIVLVVVAGLIALKWFSPKKTNDSKSGGAGHPYDPNKPAGDHEEAY